MATMRRLRIDFVESASTATSRLDVVVVESLKHLPSEVWLQIHYPVRARQEKLLALQYHVQSRFQAALQMLFGIAAQRAKVSLAMAYRVTVRIRRRLGMIYAIRRRQRIALEMLSYCGRLMKEAAEKYVLRRR